MAMAYRTLLLIRRTPQQLFDVTVQPIVFTLLFTFLFGGAVSGSWQNYLPIIIPGIMVQTVITACMATGIQLREDMDKGVFNRFKSMPIARISPLDRSAIDRYASLRHSHRSDVPDGLSPRLSLGYPRRRCARGRPRHPGSVVHQLDIRIPRHHCSFGLLCAGDLNLVLFPLVFLSGAFVPTSTLPDWLQAFVNINPLTYVVSAIRELFNQGIIGNDFWFSLIGSLVVVIIFAPLTLAAYLRKAK